MKSQSIPRVQQRLMEFIRTHFQTERRPYNVVPLLGDASMRQYFRYFADSGLSYILAVYPEPFNPEDFTFGQVYRLLQTIELPVPRIYAIEGKLGIVLQEDLGNESLQRRLLTAGPEQRQALLKQAIDHLLILQQKGNAAVDPAWEASRLAFDVEKLSWELVFFKKYFLEGYRKIALPEATINEEFARISGELAACRRVLCHRDYHVRNLMIREHTLFIIDFQDARQGPPSYDLASLLKDSIPLDSREVDWLRGYYFERAGLDLSEEAFRRQFHLMSIQRLLKALGTYAYQILTRGNFIYEQYISGSLERVHFSLLEIGEFPCIQAWAEKELGR
ncbi:MAG: phosphotransferase [Acidobacteria bacterium]|nr:phosphotransferase [Acidobacteriota bacterium]